MARNTNQRSINDYSGGPNPGPAPSNEIVASAVYDANVAAAGDVLTARPQRAFHGANDAAFQPSASSIVGDLVSGQPRDGAPREEHLPTYSGGSVLLTAGADDYPSVLPAIEVAIADFGPPKHDVLKADSMNRQIGIGER